MYKTKDRNCALTNMHAGLAVCVNKATVKTLSPGGEEGEVWRGGSGGVLGMVWRGRDGVSPGRTQRSLYEDCASP